MKKFVYHVEVYRPTFAAGGGVKFRVYKGDHYDVDYLHPCMTAFFRVENCNNQSEAVALCLEKLAGKNVSVCTIFPKKNKEPK